MEAKELMIGDLVLVTHAHTSPTIECVSGIGMKVALIKNGSGCRVFNNIEPIPLTEAIENIESVPVWKM